MAKEASAGELRTKITVQQCTRSQTPNGYESEAWATVLISRCKWVNAYGSEVIEAKQAGLSEVATLTMRYSKHVTPACRILRGSDPVAYEIISVNDVLDHHVWLEVKVERKVAAQ